MKFVERKILKAKPEGVPKFGSVFTDYMLCAEYENGEWGEMMIKPYENFSFDPACIFIHYGQAIFEGMKAYKCPDKRIRLFRPMLNLERFNKSAKRLCLPTIDTHKTLDAILKLVELERDWIPEGKGTSLYIRPTMLGIDKSLGVHASSKVLFFVILSPVGSYYSGGLKPVRLKVEDVFSRACQGGTGEAKCAGNYANSLLSGTKASEEGFEQVMWLDSATKTMVEEVGSMNIFFVLDGKVVTPRLNGTVLPGITRRSSIEYLTKKGRKVIERDITIDEIITASKNGTLSECFGTGTAAVISPVGTLKYRDREYAIGDGSMGEIASLLYNGITAIQTGEDDSFSDWSVVVC